MIGRELKNLAERGDSNPPVQALVPNEAEGESPKVSPCFQGIGLPARSAGRSRRCGRLPVLSAFQVSRLRPGLRGGGVLIALLILPLYVPALIFGAAAVDASIGGASPQGNVYLLGALLVLSLVFAPWATAAALRISLE